MRPRMIVAQALVFALALLLLLPASQTAYAQAAPAPVVTVKGEIDVGTPPAVGWKWAAAELNIGTGERSDGPHSHGFTWIFFAVRGSTEVSTAQGQKTLPSGEAVIIPAGQQHTHRYLPQSLVVAFLLHPADPPPGRLHGGSQVFLSDKPMEVKAGTPYKVQLSEVAFAPGVRTPEAAVVSPSVTYVIEGTLAQRRGDQVTRVQAGSAVEALPVGTRVVNANEGTTPVRVLRVELLPAPAAPATGDSSSGWLMAALAGAGAALVAAGLSVSRSFGWLRRRAAARG